MRTFSVKDGATEILFIRHAEALHADGALATSPASADPPLSERGRVQAQALAERLSRRSLHAVYSSPLRRARETADAIAAATHLAVHEEPRLHEVEIAGIGSTSLSELGAIAIARGGWSHLPGTEPSTHIRARMFAAVDEAIATHRGERIALISHAGSINAYFACLLNLPHDFFFPAGNTSISVVRAREEKRLVVTINDIAHLESLRSMHVNP